MDIIFLTLLNIKSFKQSNIYTDLMRQFIKHGHRVDIASPAEASLEKTTLIKEGENRILSIRTGQVQKANIIKKGIETVLLESRFAKAIKENLSDRRYDLIIYSTPPITLAGAVEYLKKRDNAKTYLLLKDIFPQNAVDLGMMSKSRLKAPLYRYFRNKEKKLYALSDKIGCMSEANLDYILSNNPEISAEKIEVCPNSIEYFEQAISSDDKSAILDKYGIPKDKKIFIYGGNLGKPQGVPFIIDCLKSQKDNADAFFLIVGSGTEYGVLKAYLDESKQANAKLMAGLPKEDYDKLVAACDFGLIFLDYRFTIPNFPSRLLSYMQVGLPVIACTDSNTDVGKVVTDGDFGWACLSNNTNDFNSIIAKAINLNENELSAMKQAEKEYLIKNYTVEKSYDIIMKGE